MKALRVLLFVVAFVLLLLDVQAAEFALYGPDVKQVVPDGDGFRMLPYRMTAADYAGFAALVAIHGIVAFGFIRTRGSPERNLR